MSDAAPIQTSFNGGELSPLLGGRTDLAIYASGADTMLNVVPTIQGAAMKRSGTRFVAGAKTAAGYGRLLKFEFNVLQAYVIEASSLAWRFYTNGGRIETAGVPYEVAVPYLDSELAALHYYQSNDVLYLAETHHQLAQLRRTSATTFAHELLETTGGPFKNANTDEASTVTASGTTGAITLTASLPIFQAGHVGSLFRLEAKDFSATPAWEPATVVAVNDRRRSEGKVYSATTLPPNGSKRTGTMQPIHTEGAEWDGMGTGTDINDKQVGGVLWTYVNDIYGIVKITGFVSANVVNATVIRTLPDTLTSGPGSRRWSHALFSAVEGWPSVVTVWNERLILARGTALAGGVVGDLLNFADTNETGAVTLDMAFVYNLPVANPIQWVRSDRELLVGTTRGELLISALNKNAAPGPGNLQAQPQSFYGSTIARPVQVGTRTLFVQRGARKILESNYDVTADRYLAPDATMRAEHVTKSGVRELAYQQEPFGLLWARRLDGVLAALTYSDAQEVRGWSRHILGGFSNAGRTAPTIVESVITIPDVNGEIDELWIMTRRTIGGVAVRYIEVLAPFWTLGDPLTKAFFVDCGLSYAGAPATTIGGLQHLAGETVSVLADGAVHPDRVVANDGTILLQRSATIVCVGLPFLARVTTMRIDAGAANGTAQAKTKKIVKLALRLLETLGLRAGPSDGLLDEVVTRTSFDRMDAAPPVFSGDYVMDYPGTYETDGQIVTESYQPLPMILLALMPQVVTRDGAK